MKWVRMDASQHELLGESFSKAGYETFAIMCCGPLFDKAHGVVDGIENVDASAAEFGKRGANGFAVTKRLVTFLKGRSGANKPFFVWSHFLDPHDPYAVHPGAPSFGRRPIDKYDSEIALVDGYLGQIVEAIEEAGLADSTVIAITSDHGDEFLEHGQEFHGRSLYNEVLRVPLVIHYPKASPRRIQTPVSMLDVGPTLLDLVGIDTPPVSGVSHARAVRDGGEPRARVVLSELIKDYSITRNLRAAIWDRWKLIWDMDSNTHELYDLKNDPKDETDLSESKPDVVAQMREKMSAQSDTDLVP
jgi:arylsulfatase A-like enzyme